jgi:hypothetical protein
MSALLLDGVAMSPDILLSASRRTSQALLEGATPDELRGPGWVRRGHGLMRETIADDIEGYAQLSDALALLTKDSAIGGWAALMLQGNWWFDGARQDGTMRPVTVMCGPHSQLRRRRGIEPFRGLVHPDEVVRLDRLRLATMARACFDEMRMAPSWREAVVALDMATSTTSGASHCSLDAVTTVIKSHHKMRGIVQARRALAFAAPRSASPLETRTRLVAVRDADLGPFTINVPIFSRGGELLGVADLLDEATGLVIESDGALHRDIGQHTDDNIREERFERAGLVVTRVTALDHRDRITLAARMRAAARHARNVHHREWTTTAPDWWTRWSGAGRWT